MLGSTVATGAAVSSGAAEVVIAGRVELDTTDVATGAEAELLTIGAALPLSAEPAQVKSAGPGMVYSEALYASYVIPGSAAA